MRIFTVMNAVSQYTDRIVIAAHQVSWQLNLYKFRDKDTFQFVYYCPAFELSGYGSVEANALEMVQNSIHDYLLHLSSLPAEEKSTILLKSGWLPALNPGHFSKLSEITTDTSDHFNALNNKVERVTLAA